MANKKLLLCFDGSCDNGSKFSFMGAGVAVWENGNRAPSLDTCKMVGTNGTSNIAEWESFIEALRTAYAYVEGVSKDTKIRIYGDSQLIVKQFNGEWRVKQPHLMPYLKQARMLRTLLGASLKEVSWIPRELNGEADILSKKAVKDYLFDTGALDSTFVRLECIPVIATSEITEVTMELRITAEEFDECSRMSESEWYDYALNNSTMYLTDYDVRIDAEDLPPLVDWDKTSSE